MTDLQYITLKQNNTYITYAFLNNKKVCECKISVDLDRKWTVTSWFTVEDHKHNGYGTRTLSECIKQIRLNNLAPVIIEYIWNGQNQYVLDWLTEHFDAECICPIAVQKTAASDDWESHIYRLDKDKFLNYFQ